MNADNGWRPIWDPNVMAYIVWELETCPTTGRHHIQGYVRFKSRHRQNGVKQILGAEELHLDKANGTEEQCRTYCSKDRKDDDWDEQGRYLPKAGQQGRRSDLDEVAEEILNGQSLGGIATSHPGTWMRYHSGIVSFYHQVAAHPPHQRNVKVQVLWGPTGVGKTHRIRTKYPDCYAVNPGRDPWGRYNNEDVILFDEFNPDHWPATEMNRYLDKWRCSLTARYNDKEAFWTKVFICSNTDPSSWYPNYVITADLRNALFRRMNEIIYVDEKEQIIDLI